MPRPTPAAAGLILLLAGRGPNDVEQKLSEADCAQLMAQTEKTIELVYRIQGLDQAAEAQRRQQLEQATNPANIVTGITQGALGHAGARGYAGAAAGQ